MRKILLAVLLVLVCSFVTAQTTTVINDLQNYSFLRTAFQNALVGPIANGYGTDAFLTTAVLDSIAIPGLTATGVVFVTSVPAAYNTQPVAGDVLNCFTGNGSFGVVGKLYVNRAAGTVSGLAYAWYVVKW